MQRGSLDQLAAFVAVARERSFTAAAAKLNVSQSALSHTLRELEERLGVRLLTRTTRNVSPTEAGERLLRNIGPRLDEIASEVEAVRELRASMRSSTWRVPCRRLILFAMSDAEWNDGLVLKFHGARPLTIKAWDALKSARGSVVLTSGATALAPKPAWRLTPQLRRSLSIFRARHH